MPVREYGIEHNVISRLNDPCFVDYLWYRTSQINNFILSNTPSKSVLIEELKKITLSKQAQDFMRNTNARDNTPLNLERFIKTLYKEFEINCITKKDFYWLDENNTRVNYLIWRLMSHLKVNIHRHSDLTYPEYIFTYTPEISPDNIIKIYAGINRDKCSNEISKIDIIHVINRIMCDKVKKEELVSVILQHARVIVNNHEITNWLRSDKRSKAQWLSNYLESIQEGYVSLVLNDSSFHADDLLSYFDLLSIINNDRYKLLINNLKKAWNQKMYRDKNVHTKQYSINMSKDIGDILDKLSYIENKNKNEIVETLIRKAYAEKF